MASRGPGREGEAKTESPAYRLGWGFAHKGCIREYPSDQHCVWGGGGERVIRIGQRKALDRDVVATQVLGFSLG